MKNYQFTHELTTTDVDAKNSNQGPYESTDILTHYHAAC